ncbi:MAG TPA: hypothetical protein VIJ00_17095, partial [Nakamurella sp.]
MAISGSASALIEPLQVPDRLVHAVLDHAEREQPLELRSQFLEDRPRSVGHAALPGVLLVG